MEVNGLEYEKFRDSLTPRRAVRILSDMKPLNELLKEWRAATGLSRAEAARRCQMSQVQWSELENGIIRDPRTSTLMRLVEGTGIPIERLAVASCTPATVRV